MPLGTPFSKFLELAGGVREGRSLKAVIPGQASSPVLPAATIVELTMDFDSVAKAGSMFVSSALIVINDSRSIVKPMKRLSYFCMHESCGQCTPCRDGTDWAILHYGPRSYGIRQTLLPRTAKLRRRQNSRSYNLRIGRLGRDSGASDVCALSSLI